MSGAQESETLRQFRASAAAMLERFLEPLEQRRQEAAARLATPEGRSDPQRELADVYEAQQLGLVVTLGRQLVYLAQEHRRVRELPTLPSEGRCWEILGKCIDPGVLDGSRRPWKAGEFQPSGGHWYGKGAGPDVGIPLLVIATVHVVGQGTEWIHVSASHPARVPSYATMAMVKDLFLGRDRTAVSVWPRTAEHVNVHPYVLHLWSTAEGDPVPDLLGGSLLL